MKRPAPDTGLGTSAWNSAPKAREQCEWNCLSPTAPDRSPYSWARPGPGLRPERALRRKYLCAIYAGSDGQDDADALAALSPNYDFALLPRRAWAGTMVLDYLETLKEADMQHVGLTGHSRDGKQVLIEAGSGRPHHGRYCVQHRRGRHPALSTGRRTQHGRRHRDHYPLIPHLVPPPSAFLCRAQRSLARRRQPACGLGCAPRACLISFGINDAVSDPWSDEQSYLSALKAYRLLGHPERLALYQRPGFHGTTPNDIENYLDWFDIQFGRSKLHLARSEQLYGYDFDRWRTDSQEKIDLAQYPEHKTDDILIDNAGNRITSPRTIGKSISPTFKIPSARCRRPTAHAYRHDRHVPGRPPAGRGGTRGPATAPLPQMRNKPRPIWL